MKKILCLILIISILAELCACAQIQPQETALPNNLENITNLKDLSTQELIAQGDHCAEAGDTLSLTMAERCYLEALAQVPDNEELYTKLSEIYLSLGDEEKSVEILIEGVKHIESEAFQETAKKKQAAWNEKCLEQLTSDARKAIENGQPEDAISAYNAALELEPDNAEILAARGDLYAQLPDHMEEAAADYVSALKLAPEQESLYIKLADVYAAQEQHDKASEVLNQGIDVLDSDALRLKLTEQEAAKYTDAELLQLVNDSMIELVYFEYGLEYGALFEVDRNHSLPREPMDRGPWCLVDDPDVDSLEDIAALWSEKFSADYPLPELPYYKEVDGQLYAQVLGIGGIMALDNFEMIKVYRREGASALLYGFENLLYGREGPIYQIPYSYYMTYEDGKWKCSGDAYYRDGAWEFSGWESRNTTAADMPDPNAIEPHPIPMPEETEPEYEPYKLLEEDIEWLSDGPADMIPDEEEIDCTDLLQNPWCWIIGTSNGSAYDLWFLEDGTFYALSFSGTMQKAGWYEYNGNEVYMNDEKYVLNDEGFITPTPSYYMFDDKDCPFYSKIEHRERSQKLPEFMKGKNGIIP